MEFDGEYFDYLCELGELQHKPITGPRPSHVGENVFAHQWELLMLKRESDEHPPNAPLASILWDTRRFITQRHAREADELSATLSKKFPGFAASDFGMRIDAAKAAETTRGWKP